MCHHTPALHTTLPSRPRAAAEARALLRQHLCHRHAAPSLTAAELVLTELVSNAVRHGAPPITLDVDCVNGPGLVLRVTDAGTGRVTVVRATLGAEGGRGVHLVAALATSWGVDQSEQVEPAVQVDGGPGALGRAAGTRKVVWATFDHEQPTAAALTLTHRGAGAPHPTSPARRRQSPPASGD